MFVKEPARIQEAFDTCEEIVSRHYENFPVASFFIPREQRRYVAAIYAFARTADDVADEEGLSGEERLQKLDDLRARLRQSFAGTAGDPVFAALQEAVHRFALPIDHFESLLTAFTMDVEKKRYATWGELLGYCSQSANPIGRLVLRLFNYDGEERLRASDAICTALQLTNFWQDLSVDLQQNRIYVPLEDLERFHCSEDALLQQRYNDELRRLLTFEVERTQALFSAGRPLLKSVGRDLSFQLRLTWLGGMTILEKIRHENYDVFHHRPTLSLLEKGSLVLRAWLNSVKER